MFLKEVSNAQQGCIFYIKNVVKIAILLQLKITVFFIHIFYSCDGKGEFSACNKKNK